MSSNVSDRLRQLMGGPEARTGETPPGLTHAGFVPPDAVEMRKEDTDLANRIADIKVQVTEIRLPGKYDSVPELSMSVGSKTDFRDDQLKDRFAIKLSKLTDTDTVLLGRKLVEGLVIGMSQITIGSIFVIAFQLKPPGGGLNARVFPDQDEIMCTGDMEYTSLGSKKMVGQQGSFAPTESGEAADLATGYAYLAASLLKMFTRSFENYGITWGHVVKNFPKFYGDDCPVTGVTPDKQVLEYIHNQFAMTEIYKNTLYRFLYNAGSRSSAASLKRYLFEMHLSHTGMHAVSILVRLCSALNCSPRKILSVVYAEAFDSQISELIACLQLMRNTDDNHKRQMWKYGRVFEPEFMANLQTKSCAKFVYLLASMLKEENSVSAQRILEIKQLEEVSADNRLRCTLGAKKLLRILNSMGEVTVASQVFSA